MAILIEETINTIRMEEEGINVVSGSYIETGITGGIASIKVIPSRDYLPGTHSVVVQYLGDNQHTASRPEQVSFSLPNLSSSIVSITSKDINVGQNEVIQCVVPASASGVCRCILTCGNFTLENTGSVVGGKAKIVFQALSVAGPYTASCQYLGDDLFAESEIGNSYFTVSP